MGERRWRALRVTGCIVIVSLVIPAVAIAAVNRLTISAPHHAKLGVTFNYGVSGSSASAHNHLATFLTTAATCAKTFKGELASPFGVTEVSEAVPKGHFSRSYHATSHSAGAHYICAYLYRNQSKGTVRRAASKYVTS